ncbi:MAG: cytochrome c biogenesis protein [Bradymonadaceae bacterium]
MELFEDKLGAYYVHLAVVATLALCASFVLIWGYASVDRSMGIVQKIFYSHVPAAMAAYAGFTVTSVGSLLYLLRPHRDWDVLAVAGVEVGLLFCAYVLLSGPLWALKAWGEAWVWDPQLTATFVLFLLYGAYALLRAFSDADERMRRVAAVLGVIAFVDIPIIHYAVQKWGGMHPIVERSGGGGLAPTMKTTFTVSMLAFFVLFAALLWLAVRVRRLEWRIEGVELDVEDARRAKEETRER